MRFHRIRPVVSVCGLCVVLVFGPWTASAQPSAIPTVVVAPSRVPEPLADVPASVRVVPADRLRQTGALTLDDALRTIPGLNLFRRTGSLVAHPTTQGVSLRGLGPSGVSRALVLVDGVPANDAFGGWVYWSRIPSETIRQVEVVRGGGSSVWGNYALAGVINVVTEAPSHNFSRVLAEGGNWGTGNFQAVEARRSGKFGFRADAAHFRSDGFHPLREADRGAIDQTADSRHGSLALRLDYDLTPSTGADFRIEHFVERRGNGTALTGNETKTTALRAGLGGRSDGGGGWRADVFATDQGFESTFSSQASDRDSESPALDQFDVPSRSLGGSGWWSRPLGESHLVTVGVDGRWSEGETNEDFRFVDGAFEKRRRAESDQLLAGAWVQDVFSPRSLLSVTAGVRLDYWRAGRGSRREIALADGEVLRDEDLSPREKLIVSPKLGLVVDLVPGLSGRASIYRGFRAPTINELVRPFRVRNDITEANAFLDPEKLTGADVGFDFGGEFWSASLTGFWNRLDDAVANVTVAPGPGVVDPCGFVPSGGLCRQRRNLGHTRTLGLESEWAIRPHRFASFSLSYLLSASEIRDSALRSGSGSELEGRRVPQVPLHQVVAFAGFQKPRWPGLFTEVRWSDSQYEDDLNSRRLDAYVVVNAAIHYALTDELELFVRAENLFGDRFEVGKTADGLVTLGAPAFVRAGLRLAAAPD